MIYGQITLLIAEIINFALFVFEDVSEIFEIETFGKQGLFFYFGFAVGIQRFQYVPVFAQTVVYVTHIGCLVLVKPVVVCVSALVRAEFLVDSSQ